MKRTWKSCSDCRSYCEASGRIYTGHLVESCSLHDAASELLEDAKKLVNEVSGFMGAFEVRQLIGNTNFEVLKERWEQMRATITKAEGQ